MININNSKNVIVNNHANNENKSPRNTRGNSDSLITDSKRELNMLMYSRAKGQMSLNPSTLINNTQRGNKLVNLNRMRALPTSSQGSV